MSSPEFDTLQRGITRRQSHLNGAKRALARCAQKYAIFSNTSTVITVVLGALVATREVAIKTLNATAVAVIFTGMGVFIAAVAGLDAAFQFKGKAAKLRSLAALAESTRIRIDTQWRKEVSAAASVPEKIQAAHRILDLQDSTLTELQTQAADLGINLPHEVEELMEWKDEPYAA